MLLGCALARFLSAHGSDIAWLCGFAAIAFGIGMCALPAGIIAGGVFACFAGFALGQGEPE